MSLVLIGGTPGTGKSTVATLLAKKQEVNLVELGDLAENNGCINEMDADRDTAVIDEDCLVAAIDDLLDGNNERMVIAGHYIDLIPPSKVERAFILRTRPSLLKLRLEERGYAEQKVQENVEAEVFGVCQMDALEVFDEMQVFEIDTTGRKVDETVKEIMRILGNDDEEPERYDWMTELEDQGCLDEYIGDW